MKLTIKDKLDNELKLYEYNPRIKISKINISHKVQQRYATYGVNVNTVGSIEQRDITINVDFTSEDDLTYDMIINKFYNFFRYELQPYRLIDIDNNKEALVFLKSFSEKSEEGLTKRLALSSELNFIMLESSWRSVNEVNLTTTISMSIPYIITIPQEEADTYAIIEITNNTTNVCDDFILTCNNSFTTYLIRIKEMGFTPSKKIIIDNVKGELKLDNLIINKSFYQGNFFKFIRGNNTLNFYSTNLGNFLLTIKYRKRFLF